MSARPSLAIAIPAWNATRFLPELFECLRAQIEPFDQIVVCDDASTDDTAALAQRLGAVVVRHTTNRGCSAAKNTALEAVRCDWVHFHDADDLIDRRFAAAARAAVGPSVDAWIPGWRHVDGVTGAPLGDGVPDAEALGRDPVAVNLRATVNNVGVYRTERVRACGGFRAEPAQLHNEDRAFHLALAESGARFAAGREPLVTTRRFGGSMSQGSALRCLQAHAAVTLDYIARRPGQHAADAAAALWQAATGLATHGDFAAADRCIVAASRLGHPVDPAASATFAALCRLGPRTALRLREHAIRWLRPGLRRA
jgi:hypothetical protein